MIGLFLKKLSINGLLVDYLLKMKTLVLLRHAKSSWDYPLDDIDRPLKSKGVHKITRVSKENKRIFAISDAVITSPAIRAVHTANILIRETNLEFNKLLINEYLYTFSSISVEKEIKRIPDKFDYVIFVGHNPAFTEIINKVAKKKINNMPTASWAKIVFKENNWSEVTNGKLTLDYSIK